MAAGEEELPDEQRRAAKESATRHIHLATEVLRAEGKGAVVAITGVVGTGKSTAADVVSEALGRAVVISSDRVRKRLAGIDDTQRRPAPVDGGIYTEDDTRRVYAGLLERARAVVASGRVAVLDATYSHEAQRADAIEFANLCNVPFLLVEMRCPRELALKRLTDREQAGRGPSDAGPTFYSESVARFASVTASEPCEHVVIDTESPSWRLTLERRVRTWRGQA
jgi:predicted kinase